MSPGVSEADLLSVLDKRARHAQLEPGGRLHRHAGDKRHLGLTAGELTTSPAITIHPDATLSAAARLMNSRHLKRLPVVDASTSIFGGNLIGIVSRCDLLSVFLRPDEDSAAPTRAAHQPSQHAFPLANPSVLMTSRELSRALTKHYPSASSTREYLDHLRVLSQS
jgi:CBS-domain-containing membrane protein